jgi:hypothetical protein
MSFYSSTRKFLNQERMFKYNFMLVPIEGLVFRLMGIGAKKRFLKEYRVYKEKDVVPNNIAPIIINANFSTRGSIRKEILSKNETTFKFSNSNLFSKEQIEKSVVELRAKGFSRIGVIENQDILSGLEKLNQSQVYSSQEFKTSGRKNINLVDKPDPKIDHIWFIEPATALKNHALQIILTDTFWKQISDSYLGNSSRISAVRCWHSFQHSQNEILSPENWHLDAADGLNFIKFFLLLSDVDENTGPTAIVPIPGSELPRRFYTGRRFSDKEVSKLLKYKKTAVINATGKRGLVYVADTRLLHRGTPVKLGHRFILNWTCSLDSFGTVQSEKYRLEVDNLLRNRKDLIETIV